MHFPHLSLSSPFKTSSKKAKAPKLARYFYHFQMKASSSSHKIGPWAPRSNSSFTSPPNVQRHLWRQNNEMSWCETSAIFLPVSTVLPKVAGLNFGEFADNHDLTTANVSRRHWNLWKSSTIVAMHPKQVNIQQHQNPGPSSWQSVIFQ